MSYDFDEEQERLRRFSDGQYKQIHTGSWKEWFSGPDVRLIPPLAEVFSVSGNGETTERARAWALNWKYLLVQGPPPCAHGLLMMTCPKMGAVCCPAFDHTSIWVPWEEPNRPFIITHPYRDDVPDGIRSYAGAHGLDVASYAFDRWYQPNAIPVRLTAGNTGTYPWPLGTRAIVLKEAFPVRWPEGEDEVPAWGQAS